MALVAHTHAYIDTYTSAERLLIFRFAHLSPGACSILLFLELTKSFDGMDTLSIDAMKVTLHCLCWLRVFLRGKRIRPERVFDVAHLLSKKPVEKVVYWTGNCR